MDSNSNGINIKVSKNENFRYDLSFKVLVVGDAGMKANFI